MSSPAPCKPRAHSYLPLETWTMTLNVTSPSLYALGTVTTIISFVIIAICLGTIAAHPEVGARSRVPAY